MFQSRKELKAKRERHTLAKQIEAERATHRHLSARRSRRYTIVEGALIGLKYLALQHIFNIRLGSASVAALLA
jgi:hypothetical protein